ncbi:DUF4236 domain-containing protein [Pedobacter cryoconitis]|uniref:Uncharacterized protein DUF4236 n=1 Tax=Pedobacter cryoconitis TaxID=188932 RepID=A0A327SXQ0_9SPHI|nr:DUF4236 domain-containing protein [Pedobacter cryoconitis]RAJ33055.1 uncharacterized protein DUF4236 [Pedobacter cryoconitis]
MAWSFHKQIKIIPGVHLNLRKSGLSTSIVVKEVINPVVTAGNIFSAAVHKITSQNMQGVKETIMLARQQRKELEDDLLSIQTTLRNSQLKRALSYLFLYGLIIKRIPKNLTADIAIQTEAIEQIRVAIMNCYVKLEIDFDSDIQEKYDALVGAFKKLITSNKIWDVTSAHFQDRVIARSSASTIVSKQEVRFSFSSIPDMRSNYEALYLKNANGADLYCYPGFIVMYSNESDFAIIGIDEVNLHQSAVRFTETGTVPADSKIIDKTWAKVNKNGTPDKRFNGNYQIPIVRYGEIRFSTHTGLNEEYEFSNYEFSEEFSNKFKEYQIAIKRLKSFDMSSAGIF